MRDDDSALHLHDGRVGEVGHIRGHLAGLKRLGHGDVVDQHVAGEVQEHDAVLHLSDGVGVDHTLGGGQRRHVDGDEVALHEHLRQVGELHRRGNLLVHGGLVHGRIVADDLHAQRLGGLRHQLADGPQTNDAQRLAKDLAAGELLLGLLGGLAHVLVIGVVAHPRHAADDVAARQQHAGQHKLLHGVGIGARRVEDGDAGLGELVQRDVVHASAGAGHGLQVRGHFHLVHVGGAHEDGVGLVDVLGDLVVVGEQGQALRRDVVQAVDLVHEKLLSVGIPSIPRTLAR